MKSIKLYLTLVFMAVLSHSYCQNFKYLTEGNSVSVRSNILKADQEVIIHLPKDYDAKYYSYPVIYFFDAQDKILSDYYVSAIDVLMWSHNIPDAIVVGVYQKDRGKELGVERNEESALAYLGYIKTELKEFMDQNYRTIGHNTFIGHSLGGLFVTNAMIRYPESFNSIISVSAALNHRASSAYYLEDRLQAALDGFLQKDNEIPIHYYFTVGGSGFQDREFKKGNFELDTLFKIHQPKNIQWEFNYLPSYNHGTTPLIGVTDGLLYVYKSWLFPEELGYEILLNDKEDPIQALENQEAAIMRNYQVALPLPYFIYDQFSSYYAQKGEYHNAIKVLEKILPFEPNNESLKTALSAFYSNIKE